MARKLTELESCTLGVIRQLQPCSTYRVRQAFARAATADWSASAGTIYPVVERLQRLGLIKADNQSGDRRGLRSLSLTARGETALARWITSLGPAEAASVPDPVRTRMHFLALVRSARDRRAFLVRAERLTMQAIRRTRGFLKLERQNAESDYLASLGGLYQLEARLKWLRHLRRRVA